MHGFETRKALKQDNRYQHLPVMMITTAGQTSNVVTAIQVSANNYRVIPFNAEDLRDSLSQLLA